MNLTRYRSRFDSKATLLGTLTVGHGTNDFYSVLLPVLLPVIALDFGLTYTQFGFILLITTISSGFLQPLFGFIADRHGIQKQVVLMGFVMFALGLTGFSIASTFLALIVSSFIYGFGETTFHAQSTSYITSTFAENKGKAMGIHGLGGSVGNFLAPVSAAFLVTAFEWRFAAIMLAVPALALIAILSASLKNRKKSNHLSFASGLTREIFVLGINFGLIIMLYKGFLAFLPTWLLENGEALTSAGAITSLMLIIGILAQPIGGMVFDKYGGRVVFIVSPIIAGIALLLMTGINGWLVIPMIVIIGASITMTFPVALAMASSLTSGGEAGMSVGVVFGISSTMSAFTPLVTGLLADQFGLEIAFQLLVLLPILTVVMGIAILPNRKYTTKQS